jgi:pentatricopeptide repeat protein
LVSGEHAASIKNDVSQRSSEIGLEAKSPLGQNHAAALSRDGVVVGDVASAEAWLRRIAERAPGELSQAYALLIRAWASEGDSSHSAPDASQSVDMQSAIAGQVDFWMSHASAAGLTRSTQLFNAAIHACTRVGSIEKAEMWLAKLEEAARHDASPSAAISRSNETHCAPDVFTYTTIMDAYAQHGDTGKVEAFFSRMIDFGIRPDAVSFNTVIKAHGRNGDIAGAERWLECARKSNVLLDSFGYNAVISAAARAGDSAAAERWLHRMHQDGAHVDVISCNTVINAWAKQGNAAKAVKVVDLMFQNNVEPDVVTLGVVVHACAKAGDAHEAEAVFQRIVTRGHAKPDAISYNALIDAFVKAGETERAERWLNNMRGHGVAPSVVSYTTVMHAHARSGNIDAAERGIKRMLEDGVEGNVVSYSALIHACVKAGDIDRAEKWFEKMRAAGVQANVVSYSVILNVCAKAGDIARAERWLEAMRSESLAPNVVCYNNVIDACAKAGCGERAEFWLKQLVQASQDHRESLTHAASVRGRPAALRQGTPHQLVPTRQSYTAAAQAYATHAQWSDVERIFGDMQEHGLSMDEFSLTVLLSAYSRARPRQRERAEAAFQRHVASHLPVTRPPLRVLKTVVGAQRYEQIMQSLPKEVKRLHP